MTGSVEFDPVTRYAIRCGICSALIQWGQSEKGEKPELFTEPHESDCKLFEDKI